MARGLGGRYGLPWDGVLTWGQDVCSLNFLLVPKEEASELCHQLAQMRAEGTEMSEAKHQTRPSCGPCRRHYLGKFKVIASVYVNHDQP